MGKILHFPANDPTDPRPRDRDLALSPEEFTALISGDPERWADCFTIQPVLAAEDLAAIPVLRYARALLQAIHERQPLAATAKGNLPTSIVKDLVLGAMADAQSQFTSVAREDHSPVLQRTRQLTHDAGLLSLRSKKFSLTQAGVKILEHDDANELFRRILTAAISAPQRLESYDRYPCGGVTIRTLPLLLQAVRSSSELYEEDLSDLLYAVFPRSLDTDAFGEELDALIRLRFFHRFGEFFGLFQKLPQFDHPLIQDERIYYDYRRWKTTPVFERAIRWHVEAPRDAFQTAEMAAFNWISPVHELQLQINGTKDYETTRNCLRAMERNPAEADPYVVLARLYEGEPERVLSFAETGLEATRSQEPHVPPGVSPWRDHLYRDILRLHLIRAETLLQLDRSDDGLQEFDELLRIDPQDGMGAALQYVPALILRERYQEAHEIHERYCAHTPPDSAWTGALLAWALGNREEAKDYAQDAMQLNPWVPTALLGRRITRPDDPVSLDAAQNALFYAERADGAWRQVKGARAWLRRMEDSRQQPPAGI